MANNPQSGQSQDPRKDQNPGGQSQKPGETKPGQAGQNPGGSQGRDPKQPNPNDQARNNPGGSGNQQR